MRIALAFGIKFALMCGILYALANYLPPALFSDPLNRHTAAMAGFLLSLLGLEVAVRDVLIWGQGFSIRIITECTAVFVAILYASFVLAYPATLRQKALGLLYGLPILMVANLLRLVLIYLIGLKSWPSSAVRTSCSGSSRCCTWTCTPASPSGPPSP
jgi:exosortase/archaeosortase family protein